jgi:hypothetical protein
MDKEQVAKDATNVAGQPEDVAKAKTNFFLPLRIKIDNTVYSRELRFSLTYLVVSSLDAVITATKILARVDTSFEDIEGESPKDLSDQWSEWQQTRDNNLNGYFQYEINGTPITINQCSAYTSTHTLNSDILAPLEQEEEPSEEAEIETLRTPYGELSASNSWLEYKNEFEIIEDPSLVTINYLEDPGVNYYRATDGAYANREATAMTLNGRASGSSPTNPNTVISRGSSVFYVKMTGHALRAGFKIPTPFIAEIAGKQAIRVGQQRVKHVQISQDGEVPVYMSMWAATYQVKGGDIYQPDIISSIKTTGVAAHYT